MVAAATAATTSRLAREGREPNDPVETEEATPLWWRAARAPPSSARSPTAIDLVDQQQHHDDHGERDRLDHLQTTVAGLLPATSVELNR